jgi:citrate synthase
MKIGAQDRRSSAISTSNAETILVRGRDLCVELIGKISFTDHVWLLVTGDLPSPSQRRVLDATLVAIAEHGLVPSVQASRLTLAAAPEALQGAVAAGLLGAGSVFLGPTADTAQFLHEIVVAQKLDKDSPDQALNTAAEQAVRQRLDKNKRVPGLGHPVHKVVDPRVPRLYELATEEGVLGAHMRLLEAVRAAWQRPLPINGTGSAGAALADLGLPPEAARGFALLARTAGLIGHLAEEAEQPLGMPLYREIDRRMIYEPDDDGAD